MENRECWQALQSRIGEARTALNTGDRRRALQALDAALAIDPGYLVAQSMRAQLLEPHDHEGVPPGTGATPSVASHPVEDSSFDPAAFADKYARLEARARDRRIVGLTASARAAIGRLRFHDAAAAIHEIRALDPNRPELTELAGELETARHHELPVRSPRSGAWAAAALVACAAVAALHVARSSTPGAEAGQIVDAPSVEVTPRAAGGHDIAARQKSPSISGLPNELPNAPRDELRDELPNEPESLHPAYSKAVELATAKPEVREQQAIAPSMVASRSNLPEGGDHLPPPLPFGATNPDLTVGATSPDLSARVADETPSPAGAADTVHQEAEVGTLAESLALRSSEAVGRVTAVDDDAQRVREVLQRYRSAYDQLDAQSARAVWPAVNERALAQAFEDLESQTLTFRDCNVELEGAAATAICNGTTRFVPKVGSRQPHVEPRRWSFSLRKLGTDWMIENARAER